MVHFSVSSQGTSRKSKRIIRLDDIHFSSFCEIPFFLGASTFDVTSTVQYRTVAFVKFQTVCK